MHCNTLTQRDSETFLERFNHFNDGLLRQITVQLWTGPEKEAAIECSTVDTANGEWCNVTLHVGGLQKFRAADGRTSHIVLSDGVKIAWFNEDCYVDFAPYSTAPTCQHDFERSEFLMVGRSLEWEVQRYRESPDRSSSAQPG